MINHSSFYFEPLLKYSGISDVSPLMKEVKVFDMILSIPRRGLLSILFWRCSVFLTSFSAKFFWIFCILSCFSMKAFDTLGLLSLWCSWGGLRSYIHGTPAILNCFLNYPWYRREIANSSRGSPGTTLFIAFWKFLT